MGVPCLDDLDSFLDLLSLQTAQLSVVFLHLGLEQQLDLVMDSQHLL